MATEGGRDQNQQTVLRPADYQTPPQTEDEIDIVKLRRDLGLPEKSPLLDTASKIAEKEGVLKALIGEVEEAEIAQGNGFIDRGRRAREKEFHAIDDSIQAKASRALGLQLMRLRGIQNPEQITKTIEKHIMYFSPKALLQTKAIENLKIIPLDKLTLGLDRLAILGYICFSDAFASPEVIEALNALSAIDEATFQHVCQELNPYFFFKENRYVQNSDEKSKTTLTDDFTILMGIFKNGGLTGEQKTRLETAKKLACLTRAQPGWPTLNNGETVFFLQGNLADVLGDKVDKELIQDLVVIVDDAVYSRVRTEEKAKKDRESWGESWSPRLSRQFFESFMAMRKDGQLSLLRELEREGVDCSPIYNRMDYQDLANPYNGNPYDDVKQSIDICSQLLSNPKKLEWFLLFQELTGEASLPADFKSLRDLQLMYERRTEMTDLAFFVRSLPADTDYRLNNFLRFFSDRDSGERRLIIDTEEIPYAVDGLLRLRGRELSAVDANYLQLINIALFQNAGRRTFDQKNLRLLGYLSQNKARIDQLLEFRGPKLRLIREMLEGSVGAANLDINGWLHRYRGNNPDDIGVEADFVPDEFLRRINVFDADNSVFILSHLPENTIREADYLVAGEKSLYSKTRELAAINTPLAHFVLEKKDQFGNYFVDGRPTATFFNEVSPLIQSQAVARLLTDDVLSTFSPQDRAFWGYWRGRAVDYQQYIIQLGRDNFEKKYSKPDGGINFEALEKDFILGMILTPERVGTWRTLTEMFKRLATIEEGGARSDAYLRIAEALVARPLVERTQVEELTALQVAFSQLYRDKMTVDEKRAWNLLKKQLPFSTDERVRDEMKNQAEAVEECAKEGEASRLAWVHQAVHNYVRAQTPEYIRALRDWLKGEQGAVDNLKKLATFYTPESKPSADFYSEETRISLQRALPEVEKLVTLTERYYEIQPEKLAVCVDQAKDYLTQIGILADLQGLQQILIQAKSHSDEPELYLPFLTKAPELREKILGNISANQNFAQTALSLDYVISEIYKKANTEYWTRYLEPKVKNNDLTSDDMRNAVLLLRSVIQSGKLEGEIIGFDKSIEALNLLLEEGDITAAEPLLVRQLRLLLEIEQHEMNQAWSDYLRLSQDQMVAMLVRMGIDPKSATEQVVINDMVRLEKSSYKFVLEPVLSTMRSVLEYAESSTISNSTPIGLYEATLAGKIVEGNDTGNPVVDQHIIYWYRDLRHRFPLNLNHYGTKYQEGIRSCLQS